MSTPLDNAILRVMAEAVQELQLYREGEQRQSFCSGCGRTNCVELEQRATGLCRALYVMTGQSADWWWEHLMEIAVEHRPDRSKKGMIIKRLKEQALKDLYAKLDANPDPQPVGTCKAPGCSNPVWSASATYCSTTCLRKAKGKKKRVRLTPPTP